MTAPNKYGKLTRSLIVLLFFTCSLVYIFKFSGCDQVDDILSPEDQDVTTEASFTKNTTEIQKVLSFANSYILLVANNITTITGNCPAVSVNTAASSITVDYGSTPCSTGSDSVQRSGSYTISYFVNTSKDSVAGTITFNNYRVYKGNLDYMTISGSNTLTSKKVIGTTYQSTFRSSNTYTTSSGKGRTSNLNMDANLAINNPTVLTDDIYYISGSGSVANQTLNLTYNYTIIPTERVTFQTDCRYPLTGKIYLDLNSNRFTVDFSPNGNSCDGIFSITKYGITKYLDLSVVDF